MLRIQLVKTIQRLFGLFGLHVRRLEQGVSLDSSLNEQVRLAGAQANCIVEIGAADGRDSEHYTRLFPNAVVYAVEPLPENFAKLEERAEHVERIIAINKAMSDKKGRASFYVTSLADASSLFRSMETGATFDKYTRISNEITVDVTTLDDADKAHGFGEIDLLKMDAQGAELLILKGAKQLISNKRVKVIYSEVQFQPIYDGGCLFHDIAAFLHQHGYHLHGLYNMVINQGGRLAWADAIFVRSTDT